MENIIGSKFSEKDESLMELGSGNYGCTHYRRRCKIRAPCCNEIFDCRHCHNEAKDSLETDTLDRHDIPRHEVKKVICSLCDTEQDVQQNCISCGVCMGKYFCVKCKFFDDDVSKNQYHCDECGICRYSCPVCSKSICDMTNLWTKLDQEIASTPMPEMYKNKMVWILCNDCGEKSEVHFHIVAHKCLSCNSYNTRQTRGGPASSCTSRIAEVVS